MRPVTKQQRGTTGRAVSRAARDAVIVWPTFAKLAATCLSAMLFGIACTAQPAMGPSVIAPDSALIFEQRRASTQSASSAPDWESWQLYASGRLMHARAGAQTTKERIDATRLSAVRAWLRQHDFELLRSSAAHAPLASVPGVSASCQVQLSTGLVLAPLGDPRYYACDELRQLSTAQ